MNHGVIITIMGKNVLSLQLHLVGEVTVVCDSDFVQVHHFSTMKFKLDSVVLVLVALLTSTRATEYFVSLDGNDDNPGTSRSLGNTSSMQLPFYVQEIFVPSEKDTILRRWL